MPTSSFRSSPFLSRLFMALSIVSFILGGIFFWALVHTISTMALGLPASALPQASRLIGFCIFMFFANLFVIGGLVYSFYRHVNEQRAEIGSKDKLLEKSARDLEIQLAMRTLQLRDTETRLQTVVNVAPIILWTLDTHGYFTLSEGSGLMALGLRPNEIVGRNVTDVYAGRDQIIENNRRALAGETLTAKTKLGSLTYLSRYAPLKDADGNITGCIGAAIDITEAERVAEHVREGQDQLKELAEFMPEGILVMTNGIVKYANRELMRLLGTTDMSRVVGHHVLEVVHPDFKAIVTERLRRLEFGEAVPKVYEKLVRLDGTMMDAEVLSQPVIFGTEPGTLTVVRDVTNQHKAADDLQKTADLLKSIVDGSPVAIVGTDLDRRVTIWNRAAERLFGWRAREIIGKKNPLVSEKSEVYGGVIARLLAGQPVAEFRSRCRCQDNSLILCRTWPAPIRRGDKIIGFFAIFVGAERD